MAFDTRDSAESSRIQVTTALVVGAIITLVGIVGFIQVPEEGLLFGIFGVNLLHNIVHFVTGLAGVVLAYLAAGRYADEYNRYGGLTYLLLVVLWFAVPTVMVDLLNKNLADLFLHLGLGLILVGVGFGIVDRSS